MNKAQKVITGFVIISMLVIAMLMFIYHAKTTGNVIDSTNQIPDNSSIILYYGVTCPHCKIVDEYLNSNNISSKINFTQKEVFENKTNAEELSNIAKFYGLNPNSVGVPFLYAEGKYYIGDQDVISYFKNKTNSG